MTFVFDFSGELPSRLSSLLLDVDIPQTSVLSLLHLSILWVVPLIVPSALTSTQKTWKSPSRSFDL